MTRLEVTMYLPQIKCSLSAARDVCNVRLCVWEHEERRGAEQMQHARGSAHITFLFQRHLACWARGRSHPPMDAWWGRTGQPVVSRPTLHCCGWRGLVSLIHWESAILLQSHRFSAAALGRLRRATDQ